MNEAPRPGPRTHVIVDVVAAATAVAAVERNKTTVVFALYSTASASRSAPERVDHWADDTGQRAAVHSTGLPTVGPAGRANLS